MFCKTHGYESYRIKRRNLKKPIDEALLEVANKQTIPHDVVMEETKKRYPKYFKDQILESTVAYDTSGKPLNLKEYNKGIDDFENGNFISQEEVLNKIKSWS